MTFPLYAMSPRIPSLHCQGLLIHQAHRHFHQSEDSRGCREKIKTGVWRWQTSHAPRRFRDQCQLILCLSSHCLLGQLYATSPSPDESPLSPKHHVYGLCHSNFRSDSLLQLKALPEAVRHTSVFLKVGSPTTISYICLNIGLFCRLWP